MIIAAVGAGGIAAGAKAKTAHERSVAAAAAAKAADRAAQTVAAQQGDGSVTGVTIDPNRLGFGVTLSVATSDSQQQACSNWFSTEEVSWLLLGQALAVRPVKSQFPKHLGRSYCPQ